VVTDTSPVDTGCDYQFASPVVVGVEGDAEWANIRGGSVNLEGGGNGAA
jgi:hypothetical protein